MNASLPQLQNRSTPLMEWTTAVTESLTRVPPPGCNPPDGSHNRYSNTLSKEALDRYLSPVREALSQVDAASLLQLECLSQFREGAARLNDRYVHLLCMGMAYTYVSFSCFLPVATLYTPIAVLM
jgi:hypothetical protein